MRNTSKYPGSMKNKARLSIMTAFSFGKPLKHLINDQLIPLKRTAIIVFCVRVTSQNETSKGAPEPTIMTPRVVLYCQSSSEGGIVLFRLLVSVYIRAEKRIDEVVPKWKLIGTHIGRKTFITFAVWLGIPSEVTMKFTTHRNHETMEKYYDNKDETALRREMNKLNINALRQRVKEAN